MKKIFTIIGLTFLMTAPLFSQIYEGAKSSMFTDIKAYNVGDVITVLIVETASAEQGSSSESSRQSEFGVDASTSGNIGNMSNFLPLFGGSSTLTNTHDADQGTEQSDKLTGKLSAIIVERMDGGMLRIRGERSVEVNGEKNVMTVEGLVRQRDIQNDNTVYSYNLANASISYKKSGIKGSAVAPEKVQRTANYLIGIGLIVVAIMGIVL